MPGEAVPAAPPPAAGGQAPAQGGMIGTILRMAFMWWLMQWFKGGSNTTKQAATEPHKFSSPKFSKGDLMDMYVFLTESQQVPGGRYDMADLIWSETGVALAAPDNRNMSFMYEPSPAVQNNGSVFLHAIFARAGASINPADPDFDDDNVFGRSFDLVSYLPKPKNTTGVKLLAGERPVDVPKDEGPREIISYFKPNISIQIVDHFQVYPKNQIAPQVGPHLQYDNLGNHFPIIHFNDFWLLRDYLVPMNSTVTNVTLHLDSGYISFTWWQLMMQMDKTFQTQRDMGIQQDGESDELKGVFLEGNPYLLAITMVVSLLHTVFDMLAFKNDIGFWKNNKSMEGLSARSVLINAVCQLIILLYLLDNETSYVVLFSSAVGTAIEFWKVTKAMKVTMTPGFPFVKLEDRASYNKSETKKHDEVAMRYLSYVLYPLIIGYAIYALKYKSHKSWYSWIVNSLVSAVYMFGFILMCPQLYLNYKLKSVAHLPWRQMTYKFLNTIIDDLFAFVIKMPLLHRLSVFRDDVVFLIYVYQRWIYRVDMKRVNEFGFSGEPDATDTAPTDDAALPASGGQAPAIEPGSEQAAGSGAQAKEAKSKGSRRKDATQAEGSNRTNAQDTAVVSEAADSRKDK